MSKINIFKNRVRKKTRKICEKLSFTITRKKWRRETFERKIR